jgi:hypothetical protein
MDPLKLANKDLGTQITFVLECAELITFLSQESNLDLLSTFECIDKLGLGKLPMGNPWIDDLFTTIVANVVLVLAMHLSFAFIFLNGHLS